MIDKLDSFTKLRELLHEQLVPLWTNDNGVYIPKQTMSAKNLSQYESAQGTNQAERSLKASESGFYDLPRYAQLIEPLLESCANIPIVAADLGCGSGRAAKLLLQNKDTFVLCIDFNVSDLRRLVSGLDRSERDRVIAVCASVDHSLPFSEICDFVLMIEVLSTLENIDQPLALSYKMLRTQGRVVISDPSPEGQFVHALLNGDIRNIESILVSGIYTDKVGEHEVDLHFRSHEDILKTAQKSGLSFHDFSYFPATAAVFLHRLHQQGTVAEHLDFVAKVNEASSHPIMRLNVLQLTKNETHDAQQ